MSKGLLEPTYCNASAVAPMAQRDYDLVCPLMGKGPTPNYYLSSCRERQKESTCSERTCLHRVRPLALKPAPVVARVAKEKRPKVCTICGAPEKTKGLCQKHYQKTLKKLPVYFFGRDADVVMRFKRAIDEQGGGRLPQDIATILELFMDGQLVLEEDAP